MVGDMFIEIPQVDAIFMKVQIPPLLINIYI